MDIICNRSGARRLIFHAPIQHIEKKRTKKDGDTIIHHSYTTILPVDLQRFLGYTDKIFYHVVDGRVLLGGVDDEGYSIRKDNVITIPLKFFDPAGFDEVLFIVDLNRSVDTPYVLMKLGMVK